jgi:lysozyme family protein
MLAPTTDPYGVNSGIGRSKRVLQRVVGVAADGVLGDETMKAVAQHLPSKTIIDICDERLRFLQSLRTWPVFGKGWGRRVAEVKAVALALAANAPMPAEAAATAQGRAIMPVAKGAQAGSAGAVAAAGAAAARAAHQNGSSSPAVAAIALIALAAALGAWRFWHWRQQQQQERPA